MAANETSANETYPTYPVFHDRHMMGGNPLYLGGLADNVTALTRVLRSPYHHFTITLQSLKQA